MSASAGLDLVTGAFSYSGARIAERLLNAGRDVRTLTFHPDRDHPLRAHVEVARYRFDDQAALVASLTGVDTLYNTYWVRFDRGRASFENATAHSRALFCAARRAGVKRIVHISIANPSLDSPLPYYRGKALVELALAEAGLPYAVVRPTLVFGGQRDVLVNNIAWIMRTLPLFALPGNGSYRVQPVHVDDLSRICVQAAALEHDAILDAAGPQTMSFAQLAHTVRESIGARAAIVHVPPAAMLLAARALGLLVGDVVLTADEIRGLMAGLLGSDEPPRGVIAFDDWLHTHADTVGGSYANELTRHFSSPVPAA